MILKSGTQQKFESSASLIFYFLKGSAGIFLLSMAFASAVSFLDMILPKIISFTVDSVIADKAPDLPASVLAYLNIILFISDSTKRASWGRAQKNKIILNKSFGIRVLGIREQKRKKEMENERLHQIQDSKQIPDAPLSEREYLENYDPSAYERPSVTVDILLFTVDAEELKVLLIRRDTMPFYGKWAIPGGFLHMDESAREAAVRRIREEAGVENVHLEQLYTFSEVDRDPRTRVISIAYFACVPRGKLGFQAGTETSEAALFSVHGGDGIKNPDLFLTGPDRERLEKKDLAFDHWTIIRTAVERMRGKIDYTELAFGFLKDQDSFTLTELRQIFEAILDHPLDIGNFRRTIKREYEKRGRIQETELEKGSVGRPAMLYRLVNKSLL